MHDALFKDPLHTIINNTNSMLENITKLRVQSRGSIAR